ncbi:group III truncated hemoglobin [Zhongshania guokunii]|uniref:Group III truncated hemoglobin n=1 Tax=Zhongshania guokunii TaxID=641783 RepID=A0ABV3U959_9GAMM
MTTTSKPDIRNRGDIETLLRHFYEQVLSDDIIGFYFTDVMVFSLEDHLPKVTDFWVQQLLSERVYQGELFKRHQELHHRAALSPHHFHRWLYLLNNSIDRLFYGPRCEAMKQRAQAIAQSMASALAARADDSSGELGVQIYSNPQP